jgi:acetyltransferase-like isoleucine patch superfamily enzyme
MPTLQLAQFDRITGLSVLRDGAFASLGSLSHEFPKLLVMFYDPAYRDELIANPHISCVITKPELVPQLPEHLGIGVCADPMAAFYGIHNQLLDTTSFYGEPFATTIADDAVIHPTAYVAPQSVRIGRRSVIGPRAVVLERTTIGDDVIIGPGAVLGGEGFEPKFVAGKHVIIRHGGGVTLHDRVEVQANSHIAKSVFNSDTIVGEGTKIDALVQVGHNVSIGKECEIAGGALISGSVTIGDRVWIGPSAILSSEVTIGDGAFVAIGSLVLTDVRAGAHVIGFPARAKLF